MAISELGRMQEAIFRNAGINIHFWGGGYPYIEDALEASGYYKRMYLVDNGVFGFIYIYGGVGIIWIAAFMD